MQIRQNVSDSMGGCAPCGESRDEPATGSEDGSSATEGGSSVIVVDPNKTAWIMVELVDDRGRGLPGERFELTLSAGSQVSGILDAKGRSRIEGIDPGNCQVSFPDRHGPDWKRR